MAAARHDRKLANVLYHDWEAASYDDKWSISYDERCITYAADRFRHARAWRRPVALRPRARAGLRHRVLPAQPHAGGAHRAGSVTDLSPGMVAAALRNAENLGLDVDGRVADAEQIPYDDATFDVVVGHAVLHHIPDLDAAFREVLRVLKPGGRFVFAGEPTRIGDRYARLLGGLTWKATTAVTRLPALRAWRRPQTELDESSRAAALEAVVDIHTFDPAELEALARGAGAADVRVVTEELTRRDARLAGAHVRGRGAAGQARLGLGDVRLPQLAAAVLAGRARAGPGGAAGLVLQRARHRHPAR